MLILWTGCLAEGQQDWKTNALTAGLSIQVPAGVTMTRKRPTGDFDLLTFKRDTNIILIVYLGNQPDFPRERATGPIKKEATNGLQAESIIQKQADGTISREVLFHLRENGVWPQRMHCWYAKLSAKKSAEADQMLSSVRLNSP